MKIKWFSKAVFSVSVISIFFTGCSSSLSNRQSISIIDPLIFKQVSENPTLRSYSIVSVEVTTVENDSMSGFVELKDNNAVVDYIFDANKLDGKWILTGFMLYRP